MHPLDDTIAAIGSPPGGAARGMVRVSGPETLACVGRLFQPDDRRDLAAISAPMAVPGQIVFDEGLPPLPGELYLWPGCRSYTGQPAAEFHTLGSPPLLQAVLGRLGQSGVRLAQPGEFTLRAFLAGRLDLTEAEAVLGVIDAADRRQLDVALAQLAGGLAAPLGQLRGDLVDLLAHLEAGFDFVDEDLPFISADELDRQLAAAHAVIEKLSAQMASRTETADRIRLVLVGRPNAGKSSLFNRLAAGASALVADQPGTTRDYLTAEIDLDGLKCLLVDTAGLETEAADSGDRIGQAAEAAASQQKRQADVEILCLDATRPPDAWDRDQLADPRPRRVVVLTKMDLAEAQNVASFLEGAGVRGTAAGLVEYSNTIPGPIVPLSNLTGQGRDLLRSCLRDAALGAMAAGSDVVAGTAVRCRDSLRLTAECLHRARRIVTPETTGTGSNHDETSNRDLPSNFPEELVAAEIRVALDELGKVVGAVYTDDLLDRIFSRFCIGK